MSNKVELMDCTIRDGGYILGWDQPPGYVNSILQVCKDSQIPYCEIGFVNSANQQSGWWDALRPDTVKSALAHDVSKDVALVAMLDYGKNSVEGLNWLEDSPIEIIRIAVRIEQVTEAMEFSERLEAETGVDCCVNVMQLSTLSKSDLSNIYRLCRIHKPWGLYLADSFGACLPSKVKEAVLSVGGQDSTRIGFHGHNNLLLAFANSLAAVKVGATLIDCTIGGVGRGGGNLPTEIAVGHWIDPYRSEFAVEAYHRLIAPQRPEMTTHQLFGSMATAFANAHPNYILLNHVNDYGSFLHKLSQLTDEEKKKFMRNALDRRDDIL